MNKGFLQYIFSLSFFYFCFTFCVFSQEEAEKRYIMLDAVVIGDDNEPVQGARIYVSETFIYTTTDENGRFSVTLPEGSSVSVEADGFESKLFAYEEYANNGNVFELVHSEFLYGTKDIVHVPFNTVKKGDLIGAVSILSPAEIKEYDNMIMLSEAFIGRVPGLYGASNMRGIGEAVFIVDGIPRDISTIRLSEVEQVTFLKDANSSILYGSAAKNGVILITTKRGVKNKQVVNISASYGISKSKRLPQYLSSADYMELYNEARENDGLAKLYSDQDIQNYRTGDKYRYPNVDYYSDDYIRTARPFFCVESEFSGGNDFATYYTNAGWRRTTSHFIFGEGEDARTDVLDVRGNVDMKFNENIKSTVDAAISLNQYFGPVNANYWTTATTMKPNEFTPLLPIDRIDPENELLLARKNDIDGKYLLGGTQNINTNSIAQIYSGGRIEPRSNRTFSFNQRNIFNLASLTDGLSFHTNISYDYFTTYIQSVENKYSVYEPVWGDNDQIVDLIQYGIDEKTGTQKVGSADYIRRIGGYGMVDYKKEFQELHKLSGSLIAYVNTIKEGGDLQSTKNGHLGGQLSYIYDKKYMFDFSGAYVSSSKLAKGKRTAISPSLGLAWVISEEDFLSSAKNIDFLKIRLSGGIVNSDVEIDDFFYYDSRYVQSEIFFWYEGQRYQDSYISVYEKNENLSFERQKSMNLGVEGSFFDKTINFDANVFWSSYSDQIDRPTTLYPSFYSDFIPYQNYGETAYRGIDLGFLYTKKYKDFSMVFGANMLYATSEVKKIDEVYNNDYQYRKGKPTDALFGLVADGFFNNEVEISEHELQAFGTVQPGDIKYVDQNNDGIINTDDMVKIGRSRSPFSFGLQMKLTYEKLTLFVLGNGFIGGDSYKTDEYYRVDGDDKYSDVVLGRWTEATKDIATYPRLSSISNSNNFRNSTFWLYNTNSFNFSRVQLTYELPEKLNKKLRMKKSSIYIDGTDVLRISKNKDILDLNIGQPYYRSFSMGIKVMF